MKIVVTGTRGIPNIMGGVETHCEELFPRIAALGHDVTVIRRKSYVQDKLTEWRGVHLLNIETPRKKSLEAIIHTFRAINEARRLKADIVHINAIGPALLVPYAKLLGMKVVFTHHGPDYDRDKWGAVAKAILRLGEWLGCRFADHVIVISSVIRELIARRCGRSKNVHLIYNGVPIPEFCHEPDYFKELGIEEGKYILGMCRFVPEKRLHDLVDAFTSSHIPQTSSIKLVLAGDADFEDNYSRELKQKARDNGVVLTGFVRGRKLHSLLTNALCYALPSSHEGLPIALLEAMSYRLPVIVSCIPANREVGLPTDCYHEVGDVHALSEKLEAIVCQPLQRIDYDMSKYDWDAIARQVAEVYDAMMIRPSKNVRILNMEMVAATQEELLSKLEEGVVVTPNIDHLMKLQTDRELYELYRRTEWVICDSRLLYLFAKFLPKSLPEAIPGSSFFPAYYMYHRNDPDCRIFLLGGMGDVAQRAMENINRRVGREIVVGACSPSFGFETKAEENAEIVRTIRKSRANVVSVCVGCPKQEKWIYAHKDLLPQVKVWMALGATIDFEAGNVRRAPKIWQRMYLEWFYRFLCEPRRLFKRYFIDDIKFFWFFGRQLLGLYQDPFVNKNVK